MTFHDSARRFTCAITALCVLATSAATARPVAAQPAPAADMPGASVFRATVRLAHPTDRARLNQLGVRVLAETADSAVVLADDLQLEALARLRFEPGDSSELGALAAAQGQAWLVEGVKSVLSRVSALQVDAGHNAPDATQGRASLRAAVQALTPAVASALTSAISPDSDGDGLTDTQETWWCTDPGTADSDNDGASDGVEVQQAGDWLGNRRAGPPASGPPFKSWPMVPGDPAYSPTCIDRDRDGIPDAAEQQDLGLNPNNPTTDGDKYSDGQEVFNLNATVAGWIPVGITLDDNPFMPAYVKAAGNHPLVAAYPVPEIDIVPSSLVVQTVSVVTTDRRVEKNESSSYSTAKTEGTSTSVANMVTWNEWQEVSESLQKRVPGSPMPFTLSGYVSSVNDDKPEFFKTALNTAVRSGRMYLANELAKTGCTERTTGGELGLGIGIVNIGGSEQTGLNAEYTNRMCKGFVSLAEKISPDLANFWGDKQNTHEICGSKCGQRLTPSAIGPTAAVAVNNSIDTGNIVNALDGLRYSYDQSGQITAERLYEISSVLAAPVRTTTNTHGKSWGGAQTTTHEQYEEQTVTNGQQFGSSEGWGTATAQDSAHSADLWFTYKVRNTGTDYAHQICNLAFNVHIGGNPNPATTYFVAPDLGGNGCFANFMPSEEHQYTSHRIPLTLEQMKAIDLGGAVRIVVEDYTYGSDELFYENARANGVLVAMEDGTADGDELIDTYLIPTWGDNDTMQDVIGRYFPSQQDSDGNYIAIWTPEYRSDTPAWCVESRRYGTSNQPWCKHALSTTDWWNIYLNNLGDGTAQLNATPAAPNSTALFRFNQDTDLDGYSDRTELRLDTDPNDPASHPKPELLAGLHSIRVGNDVTATLSLLNTGFYDAYGVEAIMIAPDDSISIANNTVGGSGRVRAQREVIVSSSVKLPEPLSASWTQSNHARPVAGGYYTGSADRVYTFTALDTGSVAVGMLRLNWSDGSGGSGTLNFGAGYASPAPLDVANGVQLGLLSGGISANDTFTLTATTPRDTFQYHINREPHSEPVVIVSHNDPQGNHRFILPSSAMVLSSPTDDLMTFSGAMLQNPGVEIVTTAPFSTSQSPTTVMTTNLVVNNPTGATLVDAHLFLEFVNINGTVANEVPVTVTLPPGPSVVPVSWTTRAFSPTYRSDQDYIVMAFWTDYQGNILDTAGRPLSSFQSDPTPVFAMANADATWDFSTTAQGTLLKREFTLANTGLLDLLTYVSAPPGVSLSQTGSRAVGPADATIYEMALDTRGLAAGPYNQALTIRSSDPGQPAQVVRIHGTVTTGTPDVAGGSYRPLDVDVTTTGNQIQGTWWPFTHSLEPNPHSLHPVKVYNDTYTTLWGVGKYATDFSAGVPSPTIFGDGHDGAPPAGGQVNSYASASATSGGYLVYTSLSVYAGDLVLMHQSSGANIGIWEFATVQTSYSGYFQTRKPLLYSFTSGAQAVLTPQYSGGTINGAIVAQPWNGTSGGIIAFVSNGSLQISGSVDASAQGYRGGLQENTPAYRGEGTGGASTRGNSANGNGGGGGGDWNQSAWGGAGGGGGGNGTPGQRGTDDWWNGYDTGGQAGGMSGSPDLTYAVFGGGGGGHVQCCEQKYGGNGGGIVILLVDDINLTGFIRSAGGRGIANQGTSDAGVRTAGGGGGGSIFVRGRNVTIGVNHIVAPGGDTEPLTGSPHFDGGKGGDGRIRVEFQSITPDWSTSPAASSGQVQYYSAEQIESAPNNQGRLNLPENVSGSRTYQVQYGRKIDYVGAANQVVTLRVPAGMFSTVSLQALVSSLGSNAWFALDVGNTGGDHWNGWVANAGEYTSPDLATQFNAYWASQGSPTAGTLDVPVRVYLDRPGQILLTNLQVQTSCSALRRVRLTARNYASATLNLTVGGSGSPLVTLAADVGDNGSIDWTWSATSSLPRALDTTNLADAVNAYLSGQTGEVDVPIRFFVSPASSSLTLNSFAATLSQQPDLAAGAPSFSAVSPVEASAVTVTAVVSNTGGVESSGAVASFFAAVAGWPDTYIGSTFVPGLPAGAANQASIAWNTLGFTGSVPVRVVIDPYNRLAETSEANNVVTSTLTIRSRPDLRVISFTLSNDEPVVGERVTVTLRIQNAGQTNAPAGNHALYLGNPDSGGGLIASRTAAVGAGAATNLAYTWIPTGTGPVRLYARLDRNNQVNEFDKGNNDAWIDRYVGFAGARRIDSGNPVSDTLYTPAAGYGAVDAGAADQRLNCGSSPDLTYRLDPNGKVGYRFDHLQPGHFYHLDLVLYECGQNAGRQERVKVDGNLVGGPYDLGGGATHRLSFLVDPALYATDRSISVTVEENGGLGAVVNFIALHDVDYRYADAGGGSDPQFPGLRGYGWLDANSAAVSSCGALPYQTSRVNQTAATLRYRWDNLTPAKRYRLNFTFYQCTGANMQQHILADGQVLGADLFIPANTLVTATRSVPKSAYLGDGSLIVSVARQNASVGALVSEVALEEETSVAPASCDGLVRSTPYWTQAYGAVTVTGQLAPAGSLVTAEDPRSNVVGCFVVNTAGQYGLMSIYGEDAAAAPGVGMRADETVLFRVDGALAVGTPPLKWRNDSNFHLVDLDAGATAAQPIVLATGWNLPSFRVEPPVPLVDTVLRSIAGKYCRVLGEGGAYDCRVPAQYRSLKELRAGRGYYLHITHTASLNLLVEGVTVPPTRPISLHPGWNWIGYLPAVAMPVTVALQTVAGKYQRVVDGQGKAYVPALPQFSTLSRMEPGLGYLIYATAAATLVYPASPPVALAGVEEAGADAQPAACALTQPTPYFTLLYGRLTVNGAPAPAGTRIEAITTDGRTVGCALTRDGGEFGLMPVFGADEAILPGYAEGRLIVLRVDGARLAETGIAWSDDKSPHVVDVAAGPAQLRLPIVTRP